MKIFRIILNICNILFLTFPLTLSAREPPTVNINGQGTVMGTYKTMYRTQRIVAYLGIPYAQPPVGKRRFMSPEVQELPIWEGIRNFTTPAPSCLQDTTGKRPFRMHDELFMKLLDSQNEDQSERQYDEDCLYLNVYVPDGIYAGEGKPSDLNAFLGPFVNEMKELEENGLVITMAAAETIINVNIRAIICDSPARALIKGPSPPGGYASIVWFHSGDFIRGSPYDINPFQLVFKQKVIVVTVAYRLNIFGFFTTMDGEAPGNFGLMDQAGALEWVRNNAEAFGGNKENVCIFGQGSGAISAGLHLISGEWSVKTFQKIIAMSGNVLAPNTVMPASKMAKAIDRVADTFGCYKKPTSDLITCLRNVFAQPLLEQGEPMTDWGPIIDFGLSNSTKPFIPDYPEKLFEKGLYEKVPILTGFTNMEDVLILNKEDVEDAGINRAEYESMVNDVILSGLAVENNNDTCYMNQQHVFDTVGFFYNPIPPTTNETILRELFVKYYVDKNYGAPTYMLAKYMSKFVPTFTYRFDLKPLSAAVNEGIPSWVGVAHNYDLVFVLGLPYLASPLTLSQWDSSDKRISDIIMRMWANFAMYSNPTNSGVYITWEPFQEENPGFLIIDRSFNMSGPSNINYKAFEFWNDYFPKVMDVASLCCNETSSAFSFHRSHHTSFLRILLVSFLSMFLCKEILEHKVYN